MANIVKAQPLNETEQKVVDYLNSLFNFKWDIVYCGEDLVSEWNHDKWVVTITKFKTINNGGVIQGKVTEQFEYKTGLAHRYLQPIAAREIKQYKLNPRSVAYARGRAGGWYIKKPQIAAIIHCLLLDAEAGNESFSNWCDNYGYDSDSISAFNTYQACEKITKQLNNLFNHEQLQTLRDLLQDY